MHGGCNESARGVTRRVHGGCKRGCSHKPGASRTHPSAAENVMNANPRISPHCSSVVAHPRSASWAIRGSQGHRGTTRAVQGVRGGHRGHEGGLVQGKVHICDLPTLCKPFPYFCISSLAAQPCRQITPSLHPRGWMALCEGQEEVGLRIRGSWVRATRSHRVVAAYHHRRLSSFCPARVGEDSSMRPGHGMLHSPPPGMC